MEVKERGKVGGGGGEGKDFSFCTDWKAAYKLVKGWNFFLYPLGGLVQIGKGMERFSLHFGRLR